MPTNHTRSLTNEQLAVTRHGAGPALVVAGAGTGKTHTICERVAALIEQGVPPENIMMLTFTNDAADEMCGRIAARVGDDAAKRIVAGTFHATAAKMLRLYGWKHSVETEGGMRKTITTKNFRILSAADDVDNVSLMRGQYTTIVGNDILKSIDFPGAKTLAAMISDYENRALENVSDTLKMSAYEKWDSRLMAMHLERFHDLYMAYKADNNLMSFDDLITEYTVLIEDRPDICSCVDHLIIDEAQDMNDRQHELVNVIMEKMPTDNVMLVGDAAQSIYGWRGSNVEAFDSFADHYPQTTIYHLSKNFRSQPEILDCANKVLVGANIKHMAHLVPGRTDLATKRLPMPFETVRVSRDEDNADVVHAELRRKRPFQTLAVIARTSRELRQIESTLITAQIGYEFHGGPKFNELACVRNVISMLLMAFRETSVMPAEVARVMRVYDQVGEKTASEIAKRGFPKCLKDHGFQTRKGKRANAVRAMCQELAVTKIDVQSASTWPEPIERASAWYLKTLAEQGKKAIANGRSDRTEKEQEQDLKEAIAQAKEDLDTLAQIASRETSLTAFLDRMALESPNVAEGDDVQLILSTIHSAKGLEWDRVIVLDVVDENFPGEPREHDPKLIEQELEEQRRCLYVAVTRAKEHLVITVPRRMMVKGQSMMTTRCRYL